MKALYIEDPGVDRAKSSNTDAEGDTGGSETEDEAEAAASAATADKGELLEAVVENSDDFENKTVLEALQCGATFSNPLNGMIDDFNLNFIFILKIVLIQVAYD